MLTSDTAVKPAKSLVSPSVLRTMSDTRGSLHGAAGRGWSAAPNSSLGQWAALILHRHVRFVTRDGAEDLVVVPGLARLSRSLDLDEEGRADDHAVLAHVGVLEQRI